MKEQTIPFIKSTKEKKSKKNKKDEIEEEEINDGEKKEILKEKIKWIESQEEKFVENTAKEKSPTKKQKKKKKHAEYNLQERIKLFK